MDRLTLSQDAHVLLRSDAFNRAYDRAHDGIIDTWKKADSHEERETAWHTLKALELVKIALTMNASEAIQTEVKAKALQPR